MDERDAIRQPETVSKPVADYLDMTAPRSLGPKRRPRRRDRQGRIPPPAHRQPRA